MLRDLRNGIVLGGGSQVVLGTVDGLQSLSPTGHTAVPKGSGRNRDRRPHRAEVHPVPHLLSFRACSECSRFDQGEKGGRHSFQNVLVGFLPAQSPFPDSAQRSPGHRFRIWVQVVPSLHRLGHGPSGRWLSCAESTAGKGMNTAHCSWSWTHPSHSTHPSTWIKPTPKYLLQVMEKQGSCIQEVLVGHLVKKLMVKGLQGAGMTWMVPNHAVQIIWL